MLSLPIAYALNYSSITIIMIILSLSGQSILSADLAILGATTFFIFQSFSGNSRNILLNKNSLIDFKEILKIRLLFILPIILIIYFITNSLSEIDFYIILAVIIRKTIDWFDDLHLVQLENQSNKRKPLYYILLQIVTIVVFLISIFVYSNVFIGILFWSIAPIFLSLQFYISSINKELFFLKINNFKLFIPHLSSTVIIGISLYIFRMLIINLTGKEIAGDLFTAFSAGSLLGTFISHSLGPTLVKFMNENKILTIPLKYQICFFIFIFLGFFIICILFIKYEEFNFLEKSLFFWKAVGFSMIGGGIMAYAQITKVYILQHPSNFNLMGLEIVYNLIIIAVIPLSSFFVTIEFLPFLYLLSSILALSFYKSFQFNNINNKNFFNRLKPYLSSITLILLCLPIFFQLKGNIFLDIDFNKIKSNQSILSLPLPMSLICFPIVFLVYSAYEKASLGFYIIFFTLIIMSLSMLFQDYQDWGNLKNKFLSIIQFIVPFFGFVLYYFISSKDVNFEKNLYKIILLLLLLFLPLQLTASFLNNGFYSLSSNVFLFSIYQNDQYIPAIIVACFLMIISIYWDKKKYKPFLIIIGICLSIYVNLSSLLLVKIFFVAGLFLFLLCQLLLYKKYKPILYASFLLIIFFLMPTLTSKIKNIELIFFNSQKENILKTQVKQIIQIASKSRSPTNLKHRIYFYLYKFDKYKDDNSKIYKWVYGDEIFQYNEKETSIETTPEYILKIHQKLPQIKERIFYWKFYVKKIIESPYKLFFGQKIFLDKGDFINFSKYNEKAITYSSAHNYYIDLIFHFGLISLIPLGYLLYRCLNNVIYFVKNKNIKLFKETDQIIILTFIVFYFFCIENNLLVSLKQPFSGIFIFFILALLYDKILPENITKLKLRND